MMHFGFAGLYGSPYGASSRDGQPPSGRPWSCWRAKSGKWVLSSECGDRSREPFHENPPDSRKPNVWEINYGFYTAVSPSERSRLWSALGESGRLRGVIGAFGTMASENQKALNALTKEYVPDYSSAYDLTKTLASTSGPAGPLAPSLWLSFVTGDATRRAEVVRKIGEQVRTARGQNPTPPTQQPAAPVVTEEEEDPTPSTTTYLIGGLAILGIVGGGYLLLRSR